MGDPPSFTTTGHSSSNEDPVQVPATIEIVVGESGN